MVGTKTQGKSPPVVKIDGKQLDATAIGLLELAVVETDLIAPSVARLEFSDRDAKLPGDLGQADLGKELEIRAAPVGEQGTHALFVGKIHAMEYRVDERGGYSIVVAYDGAFVLRQTRATRSFNDVTDSDIVNQVCRDAGVDVGTVESTSVTHPYIAEHNESNWDFLQRRARASDRIIYVEGGKLQFRKSQTVSSAPSVGDRGSSNGMQLSFGGSVKRLYARQSSAGQVGDVEVRGWDEKTKDVVSATSKPETRSADSKTKPGQVGSQLGAEKFVAAVPAVATQSHCKAIADAAAQSIASGLSYIDGQATGDPRLIAGTAVSLGAAGRFDGKYTISTARHIFDDEGYNTEFVLSGGSDRTMVGLLSDREPGRRDGVYPAVVDDIDDPEASGRVRVKLPWLDGAFVSNWSRVSQIGAGDERGIFWFPEVGDEVLVAFVDGDVSHPVVLGGLYNGKDKPPLDGFAAGDGKATDLRCFRSRIGHTIELSDVGGEERIKITTGDEKITVLLDQASGKIEISTDGDLELTAGGAGVIKAGGNLTIEAGQKLEMTAGTGATLDGGPTVDIKGQGMINLN